MTDFQRFIKTNKLKQKQVAEYLETSPQYINQVARGLCNLSDEKYEKLVQAGWDISMLDIPPYIKVPATVTVFDGVVPVTDEQDLEKGVDMSIYPAEVVEEIKEEIREEVIEGIREEIKEEIKQEGAITVIPVEIANQVDVDIQKYIEENESELKKLTPSDLTGDVDGVEEIRRDSMSPALVPGDKVFLKFLKHKSHIIDGTVYYFNLRNHPTMIRQVKIEGDKLRLIAFNSQYSDIITDFNNVLRVADVNGMYRSFFTNQYSEAESVRRKKDEQIDSLIAEVSKAGERVDRMMEQMTTLVRHAIEKK
jgi:transcriptional regulator with XRE-family HTH domain